MSAASLVILSWLAPTTVADSPLPPTNDNFVDSVNLNAPGQPLIPINTLGSKADTANASLQPNLLPPCDQSVCPKVPELSTCHGINYGKTVWYDFYPNHDGQVEIRTTGFANVITLYTYDRTTLVPGEVGCAPGSKYPSNELAAPVSKGVAYTFQVGGRNGVGGKLQMRFNYAYRSDLTVVPFFVRPWVLQSSATARHVKLVKLQFIGLVRGEDISYACASCGGGGLQNGKKRGNTLELKAKRRPTLTSQTRIIIAATYPAQFGRFKVYAFRPGLGRLPVLASGCLPPTVTTVNPSEAKHLSLLHTVPCPAYPLNPIGAEFVFWRGSGGRLWEKRYNGRTWTAAGSLKVGRIASPPAVAVHANGEQDVFWKGSNGQLWEAWYRGKWNGPFNFGGGRLSSPPTAGVDAAGKEYVFWKGPNGGLYERRWEGQGWVPSKQIPVGELGSGPAVAVHPDGEQDVFWKGVNGELTEAYFTNGQWHGPSNPVASGQLGSGPAAATDPAGNEYVFWQGADQHLWGTWYSLAGWKPVMPLNGGTLGSAPTVAVHANGQQDVFWRGRNGHLWETWYAANQWNGPIDLHTRVTSPPAAGLDASGKQGAQ